MNIFWAVFWFSVLGLGFGLILAYAGKVFASRTNELAELISNVLPSANCGGCGYAGCSALADAIANGKAKNSACPVGGTEIAAEIAKLMGESMDESVRYRAQVMCSGTNNYARQKYEYVGIYNCISASRLAGGGKACPNGCLGLGTCAEKCKFNAIKIIDGTATVDYDKCTACGACVSSCPKQIIKLIPFDAAHWVGCISNDKGAVTKTYCDIGCIACKLCEKKCQSGAIKISDSVASVDYSKCTGCGECIQACPRNVIWSSSLQEQFISEKNSEKNKN